MSGRGCAGERGGRPVGADFGTGVWGGGGGRALKRGNGVNRGGRMEGVNRERGSEVKIGG